MIVKRSPLQLAKAQIEGGKLFGSRCVCRCCGREFHIEPELESCAFCTECKDVVLDVLAETIVAMKSQLRRSHR